MSIDLILGVASFSGIILLLVLIIVFARSRLVSTGNVTIEINGDSDNPITVPAGSKLLQTLADNNINIQVISTSEIKISVLISSDYTELAIRTLHDAFGLGKWY